jgi:hypothetical protein
VCFLGVLITKILVDFNVLKIIKFHIKFQHVAKLQKDAKFFPLSYFS